MATLTNRDGWIVNERFGIKPALCVRHDIEHSFISAVIDGKMHKALVPSHFFTRRDEALRVAARVVDDLRHAAESLEAKIEAMREEEI